MWECDTELHELRPMEKRPASNLGNKAERPLSAKKRAAETVVKEGSKALYKRLARYVVWLDWVEAVSFLCVMRHSESRHILPKTQNWVLSSSNR